MCQWSCIVVLVFGLVLFVDGSGIPMWEYLTRKEKINYLYHMVEKQVDKYCANVATPACSDVLLMSAVENLEKMDDDSLDGMDPYQKGASNMIWQSVVKMTKPAGSTSTDNNHTNDNNVATHDLSIGSLEPSGGPGSNSYYMGSMIMKLMPDGSAVPNEPAVTLPKDEETEEYKMMVSGSVPSRQDLMNNLKDLFNKYEVNQQLQNV